MLHEEICTGLNMDASSLSMIRDTLNNVAPEAMVSEAFGRMALTSASVRSVVETAISERIHARGQLNRSKPVHILKHVADEAKTARLATFYPEFQLQSGASYDSVGHPYACESRSLDVKLIYDVYIKYSNEFTLGKSRDGFRYDFLVKDVGGSFSSHLAAKRVGVHSCSPTMDVQDVFREYNLRNFVSSNGLSLALSSKGCDRMIRSYMQNDSQFRCQLPAQYCGSTAPIVTFIHSTYNIMIPDMAMILDSSKCQQAYACFLFHPDVFLFDKGEIPGMDCVFRKFKRAGVLYISFAFKNDVQMSYVHRFDTYISLIKTDWFFSHDMSNRYLVEKLRFSNSTMYIRIMHSTTPYMPAQIKRTELSFMDDDETVIIHSWKYSTILHENFSHMVPVRIVCSKYLKDSIYSFCSTLPAGKFVMSNVEQAAVAYNTREIIGGKSVGVNRRLSPSDLKNLVTTVYFSVYIQNYEEGKLLAALQKDEELVRSFNTSPSIFKAIRNSVRKCFGCRRGHPFGDDMNINLVDVPAYDDGATKYSPWWFKRLLIKLSTLERLYPIVSSLGMRTLTIEQELPAYFSALPATTLSYISAPKLSDVFASHDMAASIVDKMFESVGDAPCRSTSEDYSCKEDLELVQVPGDGNCFYHSLIKVLDVSTTPASIRRRLLDSQYAASYSSEALLTISSEGGDGWATEEVVALAAQEFQVAICLHLDGTCRLYNSVAGVKVHMVYSDNHFDALLDKHAPVSETLNYPLPCMLGETDASPNLPCYNELISNTLNTGRRDKYKNVVTEYSLWSLCYDRLCHTKNFGFSSSMGVAVAEVLHCNDVFKTDSASSAFVVTESDHSVIEYFADAVGCRVTTSTRDPVLVARSLVQTTLIDFNTTSVAEERVNGMLKHDHLVICPPYHSDRLYTIDDDKYDNYLRHRLLSLKVLRSGGNMLLFFPVGPSKYCFSLLSSLFGHFTTVSIHRPSFVAPHFPWLLIALSGFKGDYSVVDTLKTSNANPVCDVLVREVLVNASEDATQLIVNAVTRIIRDVTTRRKGEFVQGETCPVSLYNYMCRKLPRLGRIRGGASSVVEVEELSDDVFFPADGEFDLSVSFACDLAFVIEHFKRDVPKLGVNIIRSTILERFSYTFTKQLLDDIAESLCVKPYNIVCDRYVFEVMERMVERKLEIVRPGDWRFLLCLYVETLNGKSFLTLNVSKSDIMRGAVITTKHFYCKRDLLSSWRFVRRAVPDARKLFAFMRHEDPSFLNKPVGSVKDELFAPVMRRVLLDHVRPLSNSVAPRRPSCFKDPPVFRGSDTDANLDDSSRDEVAASAPDDRDDCLPRPEVVSSNDSLPCYERAVAIVDDAAGDTMSEDSYNPDAERDYVAPVSPERFSEVFPEPSHVLDRHVYPVTKTTCWQDVVLAEFKVIQRETVNNVRAQCIMAYNIYKQTQRSLLQSKLVDFRDITIYLNGKKIIGVKDLDILRSKFRYVFAWESTPDSGKFLSTVCDVMPSNFVTYEALKVFTEYDLYKIVETLAHVDPLPSNKGLIQAAAGCGKTTSIVSSVSKLILDEFIVLTSTREGATDVAARLIQKFHERGNMYSLEAVQKRVRTIDSYLMHFPQTVDVLMIDEALMQHFGKIIAAVHFSKCKVLRCYGDALQIPFISRLPGFKCQFDNSAKCLPIVEVLYISFRVPRDVAACLHDDYYKHNMKNYIKRGMLSASKAPIPSMHFHKLNSLAQLPRKPNRTYLVFTQAEKSELSVYLQLPVSTVHEFQGKEADHIILVRISKVLSDKVFHQSEHAVTAITRHKKSLHYYSLLSEAGTVKDFIMKNFNESSAKIRQVTHPKEDSIRGGGVVENLDSRLYKYQIPKQIATCPIVSLEKLDRNDLLISRGYTRDKSFEFRSDNHCSGKLLINRDMSLNLTKFSSIIGSLDKAVAGVRVKLGPGVLSQLDLDLAKRVLRKSGASSVILMDGAADVVTDEVFASACMSGIVGLPTTVPLSDRFINDDRTVVGRSRIFKVESCAPLIQEFVNRFLPGTTYFDMSFDAAIFHYSDYDSVVTDIKYNNVVKPYVPRSFDTMRPVIKTACFHPQQVSPRNVLAAIAKRNQNVPNLASVIDTMSSASDMLDRLVSMTTCLCLDPIQLNSQDMQSWLNDQKSAVISQIVPPASVFGCAVDDYMFALKANPKPDLTLDSVVTYPQPQTIIYQEKYINIVFCTIWRVIRDRLVNALNRNNMIYTSASDDDFCARMTSAFPPSRAKFYNALELDMKKYDKSQGAVILEFECMLLTYFGVGSEYVNLWRNGHITSNIRDRATKISFRTKFQRKSGDASTFLGNTLALMVMISDVIPVKDIVFGLYAGDDSVIFTSLNPVDLNLDVLSYKYNLEYKLFQYAVPYFCSKFLIDVDDEWFLVPDPLKRAVKLGRHDLRNPDHVELYRLSFMDNIKCYGIQSVASKTAKALSERYLSDYDSTNAIMAMCDVSSPGVFKDLYYHLPTDRLCYDKSVPSLEL